MGQRIIIKNADFSKANVGSVDLIASNVVDADVSAYIAAVLAVDSTFNSALYTTPINVLAKKMKLFGLWERLDVLHLFAGLTPGSQGINLISPTANKILFFPRSNVASTETVAKFIAGGYEAHNRTNGSNVTYNNIAVFEVTDKMKSHPSDIFFSVSGIVKADDTGNTSNNFTAGNLTADNSTSVASNRAIIGSNTPYGGVGFVTPPFTPTFSYSAAQKRMFSYSLANSKLRTYQNATQLQEVAAGPLDMLKLSRPNFGVGHVTSSTASVVNGVLQNVNYNAGWGQCNFLFDSLVWGRSMSQQDLNIFNNLMNEFRTAVGRTIVQ